MAGSAGGAALATLLGSPYSLTSPEGGRRLRSGGIARLLVDANLAFVGSRILPEPSKSCIFVSEHPATRKCRHKAQNEASGLFHDYAIPFKRRRSACRRMCRETSKLPGQSGISVAV